MTMFKLEGFKELDAALSQITAESTARGVMRRSLKEAAEPMADLAQSKAPDDPTTGGYDLKTSVTYSTRLSRSERRNHARETRGDRAFVEGFVGAGPLAHPHWQEFGTVHHAPQPFLRPAFDQDAQNFISRLGRSLAVQIERTARRIAAKARRG